MDETKFRLAGVRNFCNFVEQVDEICFRQTVRRNLLIMPVSHPLSLSLSSSLSTPSLSVGGVGGRQQGAASARSSAGGAAAGGPRRAGGRARRPSEAGERHYRRQV